MRGHNRQQTLFVRNYAVFIPLTPTLSRKGRGSANLELRKQPWRQVMLIRLSQQH